MNTKSSNFLMGYVVGLIVGEGSFTGDNNRPTLDIKLHENNPEPIELLNDIFGGVIYGPYHHDGRNYRLWRITGHDLELAIGILDKVLPECHKKRQYAEWKVKWKLV